MSDQIVFLAIINNGDAKGDIQAGTSIYVTIPDDLDRHQKIAYITGQVAAEVSRYLASECLTALEYGHESRRKLFADQQLKQEG